MKKYQGQWLAIVFALLTSCSSPPPPPSSPLTIAVQSIWPTYSAPYIAQEKGLFTKHGVSVTLMLVGPGYMDILKAYKEGKADAAFIMFSDALALESEGISTRFVYAVDYSDTGDIIVGLPTLNNLSELKGKKVSFEGFNTFSHLLVLKLLEKAGLYEGEFQVANINPPDVLKALETDQIQAGHVYGAAATNTLAKGYKLLGTAGEIPHLMVEGLAVNAQVVETRREDVQKVISALAEAIDLLRNSPEEGLRIIAKHTGTPQTELASALKGLHVFTRQENQEIFKEGGLLFKGGREIVDFFYEKGVLVKIPQIDNVVESQFVTALGK